MSAVHEVLLSGCGPDTVSVVIVSDRAVAEKIKAALEPIIKEIEIFSHDFRRVECTMMQDFEADRHKYSHVFEYIADRTSKIREVINWDENFKKFKERISAIVSFEDADSGFSEYQLETMMQWGFYDHVEVITHKSEDERVNQEFLNG
ncbi:hypothetical protein Herod_00024 [Acinetobacter phage Herod]|nr:hypothetical protein Herod_00024 [Acinetobacter phage Herod]